MRVRGRIVGVGILLLLAGCVEDADGDGYGVGVDCDDTNPTAHPGGVEYWDNVDNDCDGVVDLSPFYRWLDEQEPNDARFDECYVGRGQWLGTLAPTGMAAFFDGRIDEVVPEDYDVGDMECLGFRLQEDSILHVAIEWTEPSADLDFMIWSQWEDGTKQAFILSTSQAPFVEGGSTNGSLDRDHPVYLWLSAYDGAPTDYRVTLWTTWESGTGSP